MISIDHIGADYRSAFVSDNARNGVHFGAGTATGNRNADYQQG